MGKEFCKDFPRKLLGDSATEPKEKEDHKVDGASRSNQKKMTTEALVS